MHKVLSIIIPVYNVEKYLDKCLKSIVEGNINVLGAVEIIIVDDGSPDKSGEIADKYAEKYSCIKVIHQNNAGVAAARNVGIQKAAGEWLYFMDSDDWLEYGAVAVILQETRKYSKADILLFDAYKNMSDNEKSWEHFDSEMIFADMKKISRLQAGVLYFPILGNIGGLKTKTPLAAPWDKIYRRKFVKENKLCFQQHLKVLDDMVFNVEAFGAAKEVVYCKERIYHYRYVSDSITNSYKPDRVMQDRKVWEYLNQYAKKQIESKAWNVKQQKYFERALYCREIKSFSICCRLNFFHEKNEKSVSNRLKYVKEVLNSQPYKDAFQKVHYRDLEWKLKFMAIMGKFKSSYGVYILHIGQNILCERR